MMRHSSYVLAVVAALLFSANARAAFVINEFDSDTRNTPSTDYAEFIELKGDPGQSANGLVLVWFNGNGVVSYRAIDLDGLTADSNGYLLLGTTAVPGCDYTFSGNTLQNGEDAIALYTGDATSFPNGTAPTSAGLIDHVIYETGADADSNWADFGNATWSVIDENQYLNGDDHSISRVPDKTGAFVPSVPTPRGANTASGYAVNTIWKSPPRFNQVTAQTLTTATLEIENTGAVPLTVYTFALDTPSSSVFSVLAPAAPALPATLATNEKVTLLIGFQESDVSVNKIYSGSASYTCDSPTLPSATVPLSVELVRATQTASAGDVKVNEVCYNPSTNDYNNDGSTASQNDEFVELYNTTAAPITVEGWEIRIKDGDTTTEYSYIFPLGTTIAANGFLVMFSGGTPTGFAPGTAFARAVSQAIIRNVGARVEVNDATTRIDGVAYLVAEDTPDADGYTNMGVSMTGGSIGRRPNGLDSFMAFDPVSTVSDPSPGASNNGPTGATNWLLYAE